MHGTVIGHKLF